MIDDRLSPATREPAWSPSGGRRRRAGRNVKQGGATMIFGRKQNGKLEVGCEVMTNDDQVLGMVSAVHDDDFEVTGGAIDRQMTWRVPRSAINKVDEQTVHLSVSRGQVAAKGWDQMAGAGHEATPSAQ
jgi:hypothetical protein